MHARMCVCAECLICATPPRACVQHFGFVAFLFCPCLFFFPLLDMMESRAVYVFFCGNQCLHLFFVWLNKPEQKGVDKSAECEHGASGTELRRADHMKKLCNWED